MSKKNFTLDAAENLLNATEIAINNMIAEIEKPVDQDITGSARKAELAAIKQTAMDAKELLIVRQDIEQMIKNAKETGSIEEEQDFGGGFAERFSKKLEI